MNAYQNILEDLLRIYPADVASCPPPYAENLSLDEKFMALNDAIIKSKRMGNRTLQLTNVYYLGKFLERDVNNLQRNYYAQQLSLHYRITAIRTFYIFEPHGVNQILKTTNTSLTMIRKLTQPEYSSLVERSVEIFNGVENFGGE